MSIPSAAEAEALVHDFYDSSVRHVGAMPPDVWHAVPVVLEQMRVERLAAEFNRERAVNAEKALTSVKAERDAAVKRGLEMEGEYETLRANSEVAIGERNTIITLLRDSMERYANKLGSFRNEDDSELAAGLRADARKGTP